jgi:hypothetical protein
LTKITLFNIIHTQSSIADMLDNFSQAAIGKGLPASASKAAANISTSITALANLAT